jgi:lipopolysaccharide/colanic/teichoic acid biosynthesis glycosyltransferase
VPSAFFLGAVFGLLILVSGWLLLVWSGGRLTYVQRNALLLGALGCFALLGFLQEFNTSRTMSPHGASVVSTGALIGLYMLWRRNSVAAGIAPFSDPSGFADRKCPVAVDFDHVYPLWRLFEIVLSATVLILSSPISILLAILIRRGTPGSALFFQTRVGRHRRPFRFVKFRTLYVDARERFQGLYAYQYTEQELRQLRFKIVDDPRVTPQGRWMRTTTLDELPNLWNVIRGDMALVGPRPEIPEMLPYYLDEMLLKFAVRPGVTGLAQISGRGRLGFYETVALDVEYVRNRSLLLDMKIIALTLYKMVTRDGAF